MHFKSEQSPAMRSFLELVKKDLSSTGGKTVSPETLLIGEEFGFMDDEIRRIVEMCRSNLNFN